MKRAAFSIKLRSFSKLLSRSLLVSLAILFFVSCAGTNVFRKAPPRQADLDSEQVEPTIRTRRPMPVQAAPWQLWSRSSLGNPDIEEAEKFVSRGELSEAIALYRKAYETAETKYVKDESLLRRVGTLLKIGESKSALNEITRHAQAHGMAVEDVSPRMSFIVAYSYQHQKNMDQTLAWLGGAYEKSGAQGEIAQKARKHAVRVVRALSDKYLRDYETRWKHHRFIGPLINDEMVRRARGGIQGILETTNWFSEATYRPGYDSDGYVDELSDSYEVGRKNVLLEAEDISIGILLPLSGQFSVHGQKVRQGIELAVRKADDEGKRVRIFVGDTAGDPDIAQSEYDRLVEDDGVSFVFGPLLVRTTEAVAERVRVKKVPILSFTKRDGIPDLGSRVLRLGATSFDQMSELVKFANNTLKLRTFSVLYPSTSTGLDYVRSFSEVVDRETSALVLHQAEYMTDDEESLVNAIEYIKSAPPEGIFIADTLENAFQLIQLIRDSDLKDVVLLGPGSWDNMVAIRGYGQLLEGSSFVTPFYVRSTSPIVQDFMQRFRRAYNSEPGLLSAQAYDGTRLVLKYKTDALLDQRRFLRNFLTAAPYRGATGTLQPSGNGDVRRRMNVVQIANGELLEVVSMGVPAAQPVMPKKREVPKIGEIAETTGDQNEGVSPEASAKGDESSSEPRTATNGDSPGEVTSAGR